MTSFEESYLVPKTVYQKFAAQKKMQPIDVRLKNFDYQRRFLDSADNTPILPQTIPRESESEQQMRIILNSIKDVSKRSLASQIINFIISRAAGSIGWTKQYHVTLDGERIYGLDIRDALKHLVGEKVDFAGASWPVYQRLKDLGAHQSLLSFYHNEDDPKTFRDDPAYVFFPKSFGDLTPFPTKEEEWEEKQEEEEEEEIKARKRREKRRKSLQKTPGEGQQQHPMHTRSRGWEAYLP